MDLDNSIFEWFGGKLDGHGKLKNQIRTFCENGILYLEIKINDKHTMFCDIKDYKILRSRVWRICKDSSENNYYAQGGKPNTKFHRLIYPEWKVINHINRNGLDNRRINLKDGSNGVNQRNKRLYKNNNSGINGLYYDHKNKNWRFDWCENGRHICKRFNSKNLAIDFKKQVDKRLGNRNGYL